MKTAELIDVLEKIAPLHLQENWDNSGMQIDLGQEETDRILVALEITSEVIEEAILKQVSFIVTHHPLMFNAIRRLKTDDVVGNYVLRLVRAGISVYAAHTCFDAVNGGNNDYLMYKLGLQKVYRLPIPGVDISESRIARMGVYHQPMFFNEFCDRLNRVLGNPGGIKVSGAPEHLIQKVALCTGAGGEYWEAAFANDADVYISGDIKHHEAQAARECGMCVIDAGHYGTEWIFVPNMAKQLRKYCGTELAVIETAVDQNPYDRVI